MAKIRSQDQLQDALDKALGWRVKEILNLKTSVRAASSLPQATLVRAGIALLYAHWEGFIKGASTAYAEYVSTRGLRFDELKACFIILGLKGRLETLAASRQASASADVLEFIQSRLQKNASFNLENAIDTESNLSSTVFQNITNAIGISDGHYSSYYNLIDESLLERRNKIAHGEYLDMNAAEWRDMADTVVGLMRAFKADIENAASLGSYRAV